jgi:hypothetical protein
MKYLVLLAFLGTATLGFGQARPISPQANPDRAATTEDDDKPYEDDLNHRRFWQASLPGGSYIVALDRIASISKHEYLLDGTLVITEVNIDTVGNSLVRIYQITPAAEKSNLATAQHLVQRGKELLDHAGQRTGTDPNTMVHKKYPVTTHTKTVEYRVQDLGTLNALFSSVNRAWIDGKGRRFRVK